MTTALLALPNVYFSLNGYLTKLHPGKAIPMVQSIPLDRLLIESDSPDGALRIPEPWLHAVPALKGVAQEVEERQQEHGPEAPNTPLIVISNTALVAAIRGVDIDDVAKATYTSADNIFCHIGE